MLNKAIFIFYFLIYADCKTVRGFGISACCVASVNFQTLLTAHNIRLLHAVSKDCILNNANLFQHVEVSEYSVA
jgi:hypothetical protein